MFNQDKAKETVINQIQNSIDIMHGKTYKLNGMDSYSPVYHQMQNIIDIFNIDFSLNVFGEYEDADEVLDDTQDIIDRNVNVIGYVPSKKDIANAKKEYNYINDNFSEDEILDCYHFKTPTPLDDKDMKTLFHNFEKAFKKTDITKNMYQKYQKEVQPNSVLMWAE